MNMNRMKKMKTKMKNISCKEEEIYILLCKVKETEICIFYCREKENEIYVSLYKGKVSEIENRI